MNIMRLAAIAAVLTLFLLMGAVCAEVRLTEPCTTDTLGQIAPGKAPILDEAQRLVQDTSVRIRELLSQRPMSRHPTPEELELKVTIDQQIRDIEKSRFVALRRVVEAQNGDLLRTGQTSNIFLLPLKNRKGVRHWLSGNLLPIWHAQGLDPDVLSLTDSIGAKPAALDLSEGIDLESKLLLSGTSSQAAVHPYPGDIDYAEEIIVRAPNLEAAGEALADLVIEFVARTADDANLELDVLRIMPMPVNRQENAEYDWPIGRILNPAERDELARQLVSVDGGRANSDWRALTPHGRYITIGKAFALYGINSINGESLFKTQPLFTKYQQVYFGAEMPPATRQIPLADYAHLMRHFAVRYKNEGRYLKAAKRAFNYFRTIGDLNGMDAIGPVFASNAARISQQIKGLQAIALALKPDHTSRILTVDSAQGQIRTAAQIIETDLPVMPGTLPNRPNGIARELREIAQQIRTLSNDRLGLIQPDPKLAERIHLLVDMEVKPIIKLALKESVEKVIGEYIQ